MKKILVLLILIVTMIGCEKKKDKIQYSRSEKEKIIIKIYLNKSEKEREKLLIQELFPIFANVLNPSEKEWKIYQKTNDWNDEEIVKIREMRFNEQIEWEEIYRELGLSISVEEVFYKIFDKMHKDKLEAEKNIRKELEEEAKKI